MAGAATAYRRLSRSARVAVQQSHRRRRDSHRGYPDLLQTHRLAIGDTIADGTAAFPDGALPVTFRFRCNPTAGATGVVLQVGTGSRVGFSAGELEVQVNGWIFRAPFAGEPRIECEIVVAFKPVEEKVRAWVDSDCVISGLAPPSATFDWVGTGSIEYGSVPGAQVLDDVDFYYKQLPRHVDECPESSPPVATCPILFNAAIATHLATEEFPFLCVS